MLFAIRRKNVYFYLRKDQDSYQEELDDKTVLTAKEVVKRVIKLYDDQPVSDVYAHWIVTVRAISETKCEEFDDNE